MEGTEHDNESETMVYMYNDNAKPGVDERDLAKIT